jgi:hypothetical protein
MKITVFMVGVVIYLTGNIDAQQNDQSNTIAWNLSDYNEFQKLYKEREVYARSQMKSLSDLVNIQ